MSPYDQYINTQDKYYCVYTNSPELFFILNHNDHNPAFLGCPKPYLIRFTSLCLDTRLIIHILTREMNNGIFSFNIGNHKKKLYLLLPSYMPWNGCPKVFVTFRYQDLHMRLMYDHFHQMSSSALCFKSVCTSWRICWWVSFSDNYSLISISETYSSL